MTLHLSRAALATFTFGLLGILSTGCDRAATGSAEKPIPKVTVMPVAQQETIDADEYIGQTEASETVELRARVFGYLKSIDFTDGDYVKEGQLLFTIEEDEYDAIHKVSVAKIDVAKTRLQLAKANLARKEKLVSTGGVTREEYDEALAAVATDEAGIRAAEADANRTNVDLTHTKIYAPISGRIDRALVTKGNLLTGGQMNGTLLTKIVKEQPMFVYFDVDERSLLRYMKMRKSEDGQPKNLKDAKIACFAQLADEKEFLHEGLLDFASNEVKASTGTTRIRGVFPNDDREMASGLFVRVRIPIGKAYEALMVPEKALATDLSVKYVYVVGSDSKAERRNVELGPQRGEMRIIKSGLKAGEEVIVRGVQRVKPGDQVDKSESKSE